MTDPTRTLSGAAALAALVLLLTACAATDTQGPPPLDEDSARSLEMIECQQRAQNRPDEAQRLAECNHPRIGG
ncbi:hypothetical protein [Halomonas denitrificans]|nr:hypothetical protein [Halomonas denitrificans]